MSKIYIHYGSKEFDLIKFKPIKNTPLFAKPEGGLWGSPEDAKYGWAEWCAAQEFRECRKDNSFKFSLKGDAKILYINSIRDLEPLPKAKNEPLQIHMWVCLDFEQLVRDGIDAIELDLSGEKRTETRREGLYYQLYGWDCDSLLVLNKDMIVAEDIQAQS